MAIPVVVPVPDEGVVAVTWGQGSVCGEQRHHRPQVLIQGGAMPSGPGAFVVPLKLDIIANKFLRLPAVHSKVV